MEKEEHEMYCRKTIQVGETMRGSQPRVPRDRPGNGKIAVGLGTRGGTKAIGANSIPMAMRARALPPVIAGNRVGGTRVLGRVITHGRRMAFRPYGRD